MSTTIIGEIPCFTILRTRGDTKSIDMTLSSNTGVIDITGYTFLLTVNSQEEPINIDDQVMQLTGSITDGQNGRVSFPLLPADADNVGEFFFDVQYTDTNSEISTFARGNFNMTQDITK